MGAQWTEFVSKVVFMTIDSRKRRYPEAYAKIDIGRLHDEAVRAGGELEDSKGLIERLIGAFQMVENAAGIV